MEDNKLIKPSFDIEIKAEIKGVAKIEDNISKVKEVALAMKEYYSKVVYTSEEEIKIAVEEKKKVNNFKKEVSTYRKDVVADVKKPIDTFESTAKETEEILSEVYDLIDTPVQNYRDAEKEKIRQDAEIYFNEYALQNKVDFVRYNQANINITLGSTKPKIRKEVEFFIDNIVKDLELINEEEAKTEILVEYKKTLNASDSILTVKRRLRAIEEEKARQEELAKVKEAEQLTIETVSEALTAPVEETAVQVSNDAPEVIHVTEETIQTVEFDITSKSGALLNLVVTSQRSELRRLVEFLEAGGYKCE